jgi:hypothetical protein
VLASSYGDCVGQAPACRTCEETFPGFRLRRGHPATQPPSYTLPLASCRYAAQVASNLSYPEEAENAQLLKDKANAQFAAKLGFFGRLGFLGGFGGRGFGLQVRKDREGGEFSEAGGGQFATTHVAAWTHPGGEQVERDAKEFGQQDIHLFFELREVAGPFGSFGDADVFFAFPLHGVK